MNTLCRKMLLSFKNEADGDLRNLIDSITNNSKRIKDLQIEDLNVESEGETPNASQGGTDIVDMKDFRIRNIKFKNFRTFPSAVKPYGIDFTKNHRDPCSLFLVGRNGTGKSTIFDALEWLYAGKITNAEQRGINSRDETKNYLTYGFGYLGGISSNEVKLKVSLNEDGKYGNDWLNTFDIRPLCAPALCCSDLDIERIAKYDDGEESTSYRHFINCQLGYEELIILQGKLEGFASELTKKGDVLLRRRNLADLNSNDINLVRSQMAKTLLSPRWRSEEQKKKVLKFADIEEVKKIKHASHPESFKKGQPSEFQKIWDDLIANVKLLQDANDERVGGNYHIQLQILPNVQGEDFQKKVDSQIKKISAIYSRFRKAWDDYAQEGDKHYIGLNLTMENLKSDTDFLDSLGASIPVNDDDIKRYSILMQRTGRAVAKLKMKLDDALTKIVEENNQHENVDNVFANADLKKIAIFIQNVLNYYKEKNEEFIVEIKSNSFQVTIKVTTEDGREYTTTPRRYLNTFRFRLYAVLLKIALALYYMKSNNCVAPIIIDDVFNASDFENSVSLSIFVSKIYEVYQEVIDSDKPLQLIILTHDQMMANSFQRGVKMKTAKMMEQIKNGNKADPVRYFIQGRLFHYSEAKEVEKMRGIGNFLNLYLPIEV